MGPTSHGAYQSSHSGDMQKQVQLVEVPTAHGIPNFDGHSVLQRGYIIGLQARLAAPIAPHGTKNLQENDDPS